MKKVDFIVVGAMKAGTTSLAFHLRNHPQIAMPTSEIHFFNNDDNYSKGYNWYEAAFQDYDPTKTWGEKTPTYSYLAKVPERIYKYNPKIKLIWIFRDPVSRAYSNYWHAFTKGVEKLPFEKAIAQEQERIMENVYLGYLKRSIYYEQVERYLSFFKKHQMYFMLFEKLISNPQNELDRVFEFLNLSKDGFEVKTKARNVTKIPRMPRLLKVIRDAFGNNSVVYSGFNYLAKIGRKTGYPKLSKEHRKKLTRYFIDNNHNKKLKELTGLNVDIWET